MACGAAARPLATAIGVPDALGPTGTVLRLGGPDVLGATQPAATRSARTTVAAREGTLVIVFRFGRAKLVLL